MPFPELELGWNIAILIILGLLALYLLLFVAVISVVSSFRRMMKRDNKSVRVAMSAKLDLMKKFQEIIEKKKINYLSFLFKKPEKEQKNIIMSL